MTPRTLGSTGLSVSPIAFGGSPLGGVFGAVSIDECIRSVHRALDSGINLIDTSPYYANKRAESVLGLAIEGIPRDRFILSTKAGRITATKFDFSPRAMTASLEESLVRLKTDYVDIFIAHDIEFENDLARVKDETIAAMLDLKRAGKCRFIGVSGYPVELLADFAATCPIDLVLSYCHMTLLDQTLVSGLLPAIESKRLGLINASALAMGLLTMQGPPAWHPAPAAIKQATDQAREHCRKRGMDIAKLALQFTLSDARIPTTLVGMSTAAEVESNLEAAAEPIDESLLAEVQAILAPVVNSGWPSGNWPAPGA